MLYAHAADTTYQADKEVVYATSSTVNGQYAFKGSLTDASGNIAAHSDMSALSDGNDAYVVTESGWVYTLAADCHSWVSAKQYSAVNGTTGGIEAPTVFKAGSTWYWIGSDKTGWRANDDFYSTAPAINGPWTYQGYLAPQGKLTWMTQSTWVMPVVGTQSTTYVYWGDHWYGNQDTTAPGKHNDLTTYVFQPLVFNGTQDQLPDVPSELEAGRRRRHLVGELAEPPFPGPLSRRGIHRREERPARVPHRARPILPRLGAPWATWHG